jgi:hypothetical protein
MRIGEDEGKDGETWAECYFVDDMPNIPLNRLENTRTAREHLQVFLSDGVFE